MTDTLAQRIAEASARRLGVRLAVSLEATAVAVEPAGSELYVSRAFPLVVIGLPYDGASAGESLVLLTPAEARTLSSLLGSELEVEAELGEPELAAIATAAGELLEGAGEALGAELGISVTLGTPTARVVSDAGELDAPAADAPVLTYRLQGDAISLELAQILPVALAEHLAAAPVEAAEPEPAPVLDDEAPAEPDDATFRAVERASRIAADAATEVLSELFADELSAATPTVTANASDALGEHAYPAIAGELSYVAGLEGSIFFLLLPSDAAQLAAAMMGTPETTGDGLSAIELSAVSEALHQVMAATAQALARRLGIEVEISPPTCAVVESAADARERIGDSPYRASFRFASTVFGAEITQYVSPELARSLAGAFAAQESDGDDEFSISDLGDAFAGVLLEGVAENSGAPANRAGAREILSGIRVRVSAELGRAKLPIGRVANLPGGSVVMLDRAPTDPVDVLVNGTPFAQAKVVLVDGEYAVQILSLTPREPTG